VQDILAFFPALRTMDRDVHDDGSVKATGLPAPATNSPAAPVAPTPVADDAVKAGAAVAARPVV
jgi:hypothetical protein